MPVLDGIQATRQIVASGSAARILVLTTFNLDEYVFAALRAGASGVLLKDVPPADLLTGIRAVAAGDAVVAPNVTHGCWTPSPGTCPTRRPAARPPTSGCTSSPTGNGRCWSRWHAATPTARSRNS